MIGKINIGSIISLAKDPYNALQLDVQELPSSQGVAKLHRRADFKTETLTACPPLDESSLQQTDTSDIRQTSRHPAPRT